MSIYHIKDKKSLFTSCMNKINNCVFTVYFVPKNCDKIVHFCASILMLVQCIHSTQLLIYNHKPNHVIW